MAGQGARGKGCAQSHRRHGRARPSQRQRRDSSEGTDPAPDRAPAHENLAGLNNISWPGLSQSDRIDLFRAYSLRLDSVGQTG